MNKKRMVDIDDLMQYIATRTYKNNDSCLLVGDLQRIKSLFDDYAEVNCQPDVDVGDIVFVISKYEDIYQESNYKIYQCVVDRKTVKKRKSFSVKCGSKYNATFTQNSIGKTVFFSIDDAIDAVNKYPYEVIFDIS